MDRCEFLNYFIYMTTAVPSCILAAKKMQNLPKKDGLQSVCSLHAVQLQCRLHAADCMQTAVFSCTSACTAHGLHAGTAAALQAVQTAVGQARLQSNPGIDRKRVAL